MRARTAGDGFFNLRLPAGRGALVADARRRAGQARGRRGRAKCGWNCPAGRPPSNASVVAAVYETPGQPWTGAGRWSVAAPGFDPGVPVLKSRWTLHLPDGFDYDFSDAPGRDVGEAGDLLIPRMGKSLVFLFSFPFLPVFNSVQVRGRRYSVPEPVVEMDMTDKLGDPEVRELVVTDSTPAPAAAAAAPLSDQQLAAITRKLNAIIIPSVVFRETPIAEAIDYLRTESRRLDVNEPNPEQRGVNIFLKLSSPGATPPPGDVQIPGLPGPGMPVGPPATASTRITLTLNQIPLLDALRELAQPVGLKVKVEPYAVSLVPLSENTEAMATKEFRVPPGFFPNVAASASLSRVDPREFLESSGVTFPPGASAIYLTTKGTLIVRNTQENLDLIEALCSQAEVHTTPSQPGGLVIIDGRSVTADELKSADRHSSIFGKDALATAEFSLSSDFLTGQPLTGTQDRTGAGSGPLISRQDARTFLEAKGIVFPPGASATYLPSVGKLVIRTTPEAIKQLAEIFPHDHPETVVGLLPLRLDLPVNGRRFDFDDGGLAFRSGGCSSRRHSCKLSCPDAERVT